MRLRLALVFLWLFPGLVRAQGSLSGTVRDSLTQKALPFASVFLVNTTRGATTDAQGHYTLDRVPAGHYELAATYVGYQLRKQPVAVSVTSLVINLNLLPAANQLGEVVVRPNPNREADYQRFLELFLGTSTFAQRCRVRDPEAVRVDYDAQQNVLTASVPHALEVDNLALGYRLVFYDLDFRAEFGNQTSMVTTLSQVVFRELPGSAGQQRRWAANRQRAYLGSYAHFLRSLYANTVAQEGFRVQKLRRVPNRRRAVADSILRTRQATRKLMDQSSLPDSIWQLLRQPKVLSFLYTPTLPPDSLRQVAGGRVWVRFHDLLAVTYERARPDYNYRQPGVASTQGRYQESVLHLRRPAAELDASGAPLVPLALMTEGYWGFQKMGEFLPLDYVPPSPTHP
ncbi:MAG: carboxypeptidase-like regulatory domain-containing protein [Janthinobacterium lividum]